MLDRLPEKQDNENELKARHTAVHLRHSKFL